jgi:hypothetical protein
MPPPEFTVVTSPAGGLPKKIALLPTRQAERVDALWLYQYSRRRQSAGRHGLNLRPAHPHRQTRRQSQVPTAAAQRNMTWPPVTGIAWPVSYACSTA